MDHTRPRMLRLSYLKHYNGLLIGLSAVICLFTGCTDRTDDPRDKVGIHGQQKPGEARVQAVSLQADGWTVYADYYNTQSTPIGAVILLHQRGGNASDWQKLCIALRDAGIAALAIDQRGAGRSVGVGNNQDDKATWDTSSDIAAGVKFLIKQNRAYQHHLGIVGASYGANNALIFAVKHKIEIQALSLFSPGADYNGLDALTPAKSWEGPLILFYSLHDEKAGLGPQQIRDASPSHDKLGYQFDDDKHGTELLSPENIDANVVFFTRTLK